MARLRDINRSLPMQLLLARESSMSLFRPMLRSFGLTDQQWRVIRVLASRDKLEAYELATQSIILPPSLTRILKNLEEGGLLSRSSDPSDQRKVLISLTRKGRKVYQQVVPESEKIYRALEAKIGSAELDDFLSKLVSLNDRLTG
ncbi:MAG: homoprotocatechuate degradation operon regulator HpaR [Proteobacteria bacterium]|nr:homoprotocatechuate degradation operon regulator HpaR [Pseudomonadota bacterium]